jgi:hypothetical protein
VDLKHTPTGLRNIYTDPRVESCTVQIQTHGPMVRRHRPDSLADWQFMTLALTRQTHEIIVYCDRTFVMPQVKELFRGIPRSLVAVMCQCAVYQ